MNILFIDPMRRRVSSVLAILFSRSDFERHVRQCLDRRVERAVLRVTHPLDAERAGGKPGDVKPERFEVFLVWPRHVRRDADVMITPPELGDDRRRLDAT